MDTDNGGWTLVYAYNFTSWEWYMKIGMAVTPWPNGWVPGDVSVSVIPPSNPTDFNAIDFILWRQIGQDFLLTSNINHWFSCKPVANAGNLVMWSKGQINCHNVKNVGTKCPGTAPDNIEMFASAPIVQFKGSTYNTFTQLDASLSSFHPFHDPCGSSNPVVSIYPTSPYGNVFIR